MSTSQSPSMRFIGSVPFEAPGPSFALPIFARDDSSTKKFVQEIDELTGFVKGFREIHTSPMLLSSQALEIKVGEKPIYAFILENETMCAGDLSALEPQLRAFLARCPDQPAILLQIAELVGSEQEKQSARSRMGNVIAYSNGQDSRRAFFSGSVALTDTWNALLRNATSDDAARRILLQRSKIIVEQRPNSEFHIDLSAIAESDYASANVGHDISKITKGIHNDLVPSRPLSDRKEYVLGNPAYEGQKKLLSEREMQSVSELLQLLNKATWQEARLAILFDSILSDFTVGRAALSMYETERGKFAASIFAAARDAFRIADSRGSPEALTIVQELVKLAYRTAYPMSRGKLLSQFAIYLSKYQPINAVIENFLRSTSAMDVEIYRQFIEECLQERVGPRDYGRKQQELNAVRESIPRAVENSPRQASYKPRETAPRERTAAEPTSTLKEIRDSAVIAPQQSVLLMNREIERSLVKAIAVRGLLNGRNQVSVKGIFKELQQFGMPPNLSGSLEQIQGARNAIAHGRGDLKDEALLQALDSGMTILEALKGMPAEKNVIYHSGVEIYEDEECARSIKGAKGIILETTSPGGFIKSHRIYPSTLIHFRKGMEVSWEWNMAHVWQRAWYRDPDIGEIKSAWHSSAEFVGRDLEALTATVRVDS